MVYNRLRFDEKIFIIVTSTILFNGLLQQQVGT